MMSDLLVPLDNIEIRSLTPEDEARSVKEGLEILKARMQAVDTIIGADDDLLIRITWTDHNRKFKEKFFASRKQADAWLKRLEKAGIPAVVDAQPVKKAIVKLAAAWNVSIIKSEVLADNTVDVIERFAQDGTPGLGIVRIRVTVYSPVLRRVSMGTGSACRMFRGGDPDFFIKSITGTAETRAFKRALIFLTPFDGASLRDEFGSDEEIVISAPVKVEDKEERPGVLEEAERDETERREEEAEAEPEAESVAEGAAPLFDDKRRSREVIKERDAVLKEALKDKLKFARVWFMEWKEARGIPAGVVRANLTDEGWEDFLKFAAERAEKGDVK